jgi:hypothetical protein
MLDTDRLWDPVAPSEAQPEVAVDSEHRPFAIGVPRIEGDHIAEITAFHDRRRRSQGRRR